MSSFARPNRPARRGSRSGLLAGDNIENYAPVGVVVHPIYFLFPFLFTGHRNYFVFLKPKRR